MLFSGTLFGQAGVLSFTDSGVDPLTGASFVTVNWQNIFISPSKGVNITLFLDGTSVCLDPANSTVHSEFINSTIFNSNSVVIQKLGFSNAFSLQGSYLPLVTIYFRAAPGSTVGLSFSIATIFDNSAPPTSYPINTPGKLNMVMPNPININGIVIKYPGAAGQCSGGANTGITNVNMKVEPIGTTCFPTYDSYGNYTGFPSNPYDILSLDGQYTVDVPSNYAYKITPSKSSSCACGLELSDYNRAVELVYGLFSGDFDPLIDISLAEYLILDFTGDGYISTFDLAAMNLCAAGNYNPPSGWSAWRFVPISEYEPNNPPKSFPLTITVPSYLTTPNVTQPLFFRDFYGFKVGDFNGTCTLCNSLLPEDNPVERSSSTAENIAYHIDRTTLVEGEDQYWYITLDEDVDGLTVFQLEFDLDEQSVEVLELEAEDVSAGLFQTNLSVRSGNTPMMINWFTEKRGGESFRKGQHLARLHVKGLRNEIDGVSVLKSTNGDKVNCYYQKGKVPAVLSEVDITNTQQLTLGLLSKNPITDAIPGIVTGCNSETINIQLLNVQGQIIRQLSIDPKSAQETFEINDLSHLTPGVYILNATTSTGSASVRIVKQ